MTPRERILSTLVGGFIVAVLAGAIGYIGIYQPVKSRYANATRIEDENEAKLEKLRTLQKNMARLATAQARSLPADVDVARREYEAALSRLLLESKVPRGYTVRTKSPDNRPVPELAPKKPAYSRIAFEITMKKVDLGTLTDFLERYYRLNLLHQITRLSVKRSDVDATSASAARRGTTSDRADLDVTIVTEAAILDGAEQRKSLTAVAPVFAAALGGAGFHQLKQSPEVARGLRSTAEPVLSPNRREYLAVLAKDIFHGPIPPPLPPKPTPPPPPVQVAVEPPPPPKEDISRFIKLTGITRRSDGTATADVKDSANNLDYQIDLTHKGGSWEVLVTKYFYIGTKRKKDESGGLLDIRDDTSSTVRKYRVLGLDADGLVLASSAPDKPKAGPPLPPLLHPATAILGGIVAKLPTVKEPAKEPEKSTEKVCVWRVGQPLRSVQELTTEEAQALVERAKISWLADPNAAPMPSVPASAPFIRPIPSTTTDAGL